MTMRPSPLLLAALLPSLLTAALLACSAPSPPVAPPAPTGTATPDASSSTELAAGWGSASAAGLAASTPPFVIVGEVFPPSSLFAVEGALFIASREQFVFERENGKMAEYSYPVGVMHANRLEFPKPMRLEGMLHRVDAVVGKWPDHIDAIARSTNGRTGVAEHFELIGQSWLQKRSQTGTLYAGMEKIGESLVALEAPSMFGTSSFVTLHGPKIERKLAPRRSCKPEDFPPLSNVEVIPEAFGALKDGSLVSFGRTCTRRAMIERWKPEGGESTLVAIDSKEVDLRSPDPRFIHGPAGETYLLTGQAFRESGGSWQEIPVPEGGQFFFGTVAPDGALWVTGETGTFRRHRETWERVLMPDGLESCDDLATFEGQVWATAGNVLLRQRKPGETGAGAPIKPHADPTSASKARKIARPGSYRCTQNLVVLYAFTKLTPDDYDFPLTRKALTGHLEFQDVRFLVTRDGGTRYFTAQVTSFEQGKKLVAHIEKTVKDAKPQLVCADPEVLREVKLNLATGKVIP